MNLASSKRIAVGQVFQESHDFNPVNTELEDFVIERGRDALSDNNLNAGSTFGGILRYLAAAGVTVRPILAARARPGGPLSQHTYQTIKSLILEGLKAELPLDAVVFELHGAMTAVDLGSTEADLIPAIRAVVGPATVIAVGLDLHAYMGAALLTAANIVTTCKEHPHVDVVETGERTARMALEILDGQIKPVTAFASLPLLLRGGYETSEHPMEELHDAARALQAKSPGTLLDISICNVNPFLDVENMGQSFIAITNGDPKLAADTVRELALECWRRKDEFVDDFVDLDTALATIDANPSLRPYVLSDYGDRVLAGAPGDSLEILRVLAASGKNLSCAIAVTDPDGAREASDAGVGATVSIQLGGKFTPFLAPMLVEGEVVSVSDGIYIQRGPYQAGQRATLGRTAVIKSGRNFILATSVSGMTQDPAAFTSQGIDIASLDFVVTKSGNHFKLNFAGIATPLVAVTPGLSIYTPGIFPFKHARIYPDHDLVDPTTTISLFPPRAGGSVTVRL